MTIFANSVSVTVSSDNMCKLIFTDLTPINGQTPIPSTVTEIVMPEWAVKGFRDILFAQYPEEGTRN